MHRFFADVKDSGIAEFPEDEARHLLRVLRLGNDDEIEVLDGVGSRYSAKVVISDDGTPIAEIIDKLPDNEPKTRVTLYQGLPKLDKMDSIIQKCVEIGVHEIVPVLFSRCVSKPEKTTGKLTRYDRIAREAVKQCGRGYVPAVTAPMKLAEALAHMRSQSLVLVPWEEATEGDIRKIIKQTDQEDNRIGIIIGPEGGITPEEASEICRRPNAHLITLGPRILRTETAGPVALCLVLALLGDMGGEPVRA